MSLLKERKAATDAKVKEIKDARKASDKARRQQYKQSKVDHDRKVMLVGEAVLRRVDRRGHCQVDDKKPTRLRS